MHVCDIINSTSQKDVSSCSMVFPKAPHHPKTWHFETIARPWAGPWPLSRWRAPRQSSRRSLSSAWKPRPGPRPTRDAAPNEPGQTRPGVLGTETMPCCWLLHAKNHRKMQQSCMGFFLSSYPSSTTLCVCLSLSLSLSLSLRNRSYQSCSCPGFWLLLKASILAYPRILGGLVQPAGQLRGRLRLSLHTEVKGSQGAHQQPNLRLTRTPWRCKVLISFFIGIH